MSIACSKIDLQDRHGMLTKTVCLQKRYAYEKDNNGMHIKKRIKDIVIRKKQICYNVFHP